LLRLSRKHPRVIGEAVVASVVALGVFALSASAAVIEVRLFGLVLSAIVAHASDMSAVRDTPGGA
jgi:hypothetical protein